MSATFFEVTARLRDSHGRKLIRFAAVSAFNVLAGQAMLYGAQVLLGWPAVQANVVSVCLGAVPAYLLSRYWVWEKRGRNRVLGELVPFWTLALVGFVASTTAVWYVDTHWAASPVVVNLANLTAFGMVWLVKFFVLDHFLFGPERAPAV
ncbi:MAG TPA: GtrA family protein [Acidimicrobiia bacterium]|nr:GtrA family protein [Acidimicrobiia bacterium]